MDIFRVLKTGEPVDKVAEAVSEKFFGQIEVRYSTSGEIGIRCNKGCYLEW